MRNLIALELKRNRLRPYHIATLICGVTMLGFQYLMAAIPYMDPTEPDAELYFAVELSNQPEKGAVRKADAGVCLYRWRDAPVRSGGSGCVLSNRITISALF